MKQLLFMAIRLHGSDYKSFIKDLENPYRFPSTVIMSYFVTIYQLNRK